MKSIVLDPTCNDRIKSVGNHRWLMLENFVAQADQEGLADQAEEWDRDHPGQAWVLPQPHPAWRTTAGAGPSQVQAAWVPLPLVSTGLPPLSTALTTATR